MLPNDPILRMSVVNTWLRDSYPDLEALCDDKNISKTELTGSLAAAGYRYDPQRNQFVRG